MQMYNLTIEQQTLLILLRRSLWGQLIPRPVEVDWDAVDALATVHAVIPFVYDGVILDKADVPPTILQKWKNKMLYSIFNSERLMQAQDELIQWFTEADIATVVLKGSSVAQYYSQPELRALGDIDVLINKKDIEMAQAILISHGYEMCEKDHGYHIGYRRSNVCVELHYHVTSLPDSKGGYNMGEITQRFLDSICEGTVGNYVFPTLDQTNQTISLLLHMIRHMFGSGIGLRQLCDWAVCINKVDPNILERDICPIFQKCGLMQYAKVATRVCVDYLGVPGANMLWALDADERICQMFISDIFRGGNMGRADKDGIGSLFTNSKSMGRKQLAIISVVVRLNQLAYKNFSFTKRFKIILPIFWIYIPLRYAVRSLLGLRPKKSLSKVIMSAQKRKDLYEVLNPFETQGE